MTVDLAAFAGLNGSLRLFWDAGIVEVFRDGLTATWSDLRVTDITQLRLNGYENTPDGRAEIWELARPERLTSPAARHPISWLPLED